MSRDTGYPLGLHIPCDLPDIHEASQGSDPSRSEMAIGWLASHLATAAIVLLFAVLVLR